HAQPTIIDLRQNFHAVQLALAHHHPSHVRSSSHRYAKRVTLLLCPWVTLSLCGHIKITYNQYYVNNSQIMGADKMRLCFVRFANKR
ncbi:hypothetical protein, partial [Marivita sp.]|uniref:hypothetical protein n=1 Tax=Marivita sp. TaxID=2003365 RepID=UPI0025BF2801